MAVKCRACKSSMVTEKCESSGDTITCWHACPLCKQVRMTSERSSAALTSAASTSVRDDEMMYANESELVTLS